MSIEARTRKRAATIAARTRLLDAELARVRQWILDRSDAIGLTDSDDPSSPKHWQVFSSNLHTPELASENSALDMIGYLILLLHELRRPDWGEIDDARNGPKQRAAKTKAAGVARRISKRKSHKEAR